MKRLAYLFAFVFVVVGCNKDDSTRFSSRVQKALNSIVGVWENKGTDYVETITITAYEVPTEIQPSSPDCLSMIFHGTMLTEYMYINGGSVSSYLPCYFIISPEKNEIQTYGINPNQTWSNDPTIVYDYEIIDINTIKLHDQRLSSLDEKIYKRKQ